MQRELHSFRSNTMEKHLKPDTSTMESLGFYMDRILYSMLKRLNKEHKKNNWDIQQAEATILQTLNVLGSKSQSELASILGKERSGISRSVTALEKKGYVERTSVNGSTYSVALTEKGKSMIPAIIEKYKNVQELALKGLSEKSRTSLMKNLETIYKNVIVEEDK